MTFNGDRVRKATRDNSEIKKTGLGTSNMLQVKQKGFDNLIGNGCAMMSRRYVIVSKIAGDIRSAKYMAKRDHAVDVTRQTYMVRM